MAGKRAAQRIRTGEKNAGVPEDGVLQHQFLCAGGIRFFDELLDREAVGVTLRSRHDVAIGRGGRGRRNAEGDDRPRLCGRHAALDRHDELLAVGDVMVRGTEQQHGVGWELSEGVLRGQAHCRSGVAARGFEQDGTGRSGAVERIGHQKAVIFRGDRDDPVVQVTDALQRQLQQAFVFDQGDELFGEMFAR